VNKDKIDQFITAYDSEILYTDQAIGVLLEKAVNLDNTLVIITSDHGEEFGEHNGFHQMTPYDEMLHVPLILSAPMFQHSVRISQQASLIDIAPTIVDLLRLEPVEDFMGKSLLPVIRGEEQEERTVISEYWPYIVQEDPSQEGKVFVIQRGGWKLINKEGENVELYHLKRDPREKRNLIGESPEKVEELQKALLKHLEEISKPIPVPIVEPDELLQQQLRDLGYL
jgi:arylsulfatase A-like enzyme